MQIHHLKQQNSVLQHFIAEIRDVNIQKDRMRFRRNIERIGEVLGYELSKELDYAHHTLETPLSSTEAFLLKDQLVIGSILRAGLPMHQGLLNYFDHAENLFISAYRHYTNEDKTDFEIIVEYLACPSLTDKTLIIADPMLASGHSFVSVFSALKKMGNPKSIHLVSAIGSPEGVDYLSMRFPETTHLWIAAIDEKLNDKGYIIPGLGDAGDLSFGSKLQH
ncbi:uracil phosphoribosyltransferase [Ascidiimonas aurantiaca]|uniref:uracil phosphoribosyltransferase n=1 Tax=Ascidiimonas aurantiaca TaxID=1685432 RepID=UPI0030EDE20C